jgi:LemA protein
LDALLKKRYDLIPNLISSVQEYMKYESGTLTEITQIRTKAMSPSISSEEKIELANQLSSAMRGINVAFENYPELKANQNFLQLQGSLNEVEEQISAARRTYNAVVTDYNNGVEMFPSNIIASLMGLKKKPVFVIEESERKNVDVKGLFNK